MFYGNAKQESDHDRGYVSKNFMNSCFNLLRAKRA